MRNKKIYLFILFMVAVSTGFSQQDPQFTQYMYTLLPINPGYAGTGGICATVNFRQQWAGLREVDPNTGAKYNVSPREFMLLSKPYMAA